MTYKREKLPDGIFKYLFFCTELKIFIILSLTIFRQVELIPSFVYTIRITFYRFFFSLLIS